MVTNNQQRKYYLTTTLPYVNAAPHVGFALEIIQADVIARHKQAEGYDVFFNVGTDEHGKKVYEKALEAGQDPQAYVDKWAAHFTPLKEALSISWSNFIRTTDAHHQMAAQEFWNRCVASGDIYKKMYKVKYCVGCELEKQDSDLAHGKCPLHPNREIENIEEENYFFRFSEYGVRLLKLYEERPEMLVPALRLRELQTFIERGLEDFSISRLKSKMPWGIVVPGDDAHVMFVWFDALVSYTSAIGWPDRMSEFEMWWPVVQFCGKDQGRQQGAMWQAMLMSAKLPPSKQIVMHGFITSGGQKMSKSLGNVISPFDLVREYGTDAVRYFLLREVTPFEDSDITMERFKEAYNANLVNGLGNLVSRIMKMSETYLPEETGNRKPETEVAPIPDSGLRIPELLEQYEFAKAMDVIWEEVASLDQKIQETKPFGVWKTDQEKARAIVRELVSSLIGIAYKLQPFMPLTAEAIAQAIKENKMPAPLFPRKE